MTEEDKKLILELNTGKVSRDLFTQRVSFDINKDILFLVRELEKAYLAKDGENVEYIMLLIGFVELPFENYFDIWRKLLFEDWHNQHEGIISILSFLPNEDNVKSFFHVASRRYKYLSVEDNNSLFLKCVHALAEINTSESSACLHSLGFISK